MTSEPHSIADPRDAVITQQAEKIAQLEELLSELQEKVKRLQSLLERKADAKTAKKPKFNENYSLDRNKRTKQKNRPKPRKPAGRKTKEAKSDLTALELDVYPDGVSREDCIRRRSQFIWRMIDGKAMYVCYHIYDLPDSRDLPLPPGVRNSRSEFGLEIILIMAFLHFWIGLSLDNACQVMGFFTGLKLSKSQADSLLNQLSRDWNQQYDTITELIALQMIVYLDETGWKVGKKACYTWVFSTPLYVLFRCGVSRKKDEATAVLGESFAGIGVTDDYAAYKSLFSRHQLCWAHLIRKAIKLVLQHPDETEYADFLDRLCGIYADAKRWRTDGRLSAGRAGKSCELQARVRALCARSEEPIVKGATPEHLETLILLQREMANQLDCLFVFVEHPEVEPTNNRSERNARREAEIRKGARTSKSAAGARRRSIIVTVLASLQTRLTKFTLSNLLHEVDRWMRNKCSIFEQELRHLQKPHPPPLVTS